MESSRQRRPQQRLANDRVQQLVADYTAGTSMKEVAGRYGLHRTTVAGHLREAGSKLRRQGVPDDRLGEAVTLYKEGWSLQRLGAHYDCSADTVRLALLKAGVRLRRPWELS